MRACIEKVDVLGWNKSVKLWTCWIASIWSYIYWNLDFYDMHATPVPNKKTKSELIFRVTDWMTHACMYAVTVVPQPNYIWSNNVCTHILFASICYHYYYLGQKLYQTHKLIVPPFFSVGGRLYCTWRFFVIMYPWKKTEGTPFFTGMLLLRMDGRRREIRSHREGWDIEYCTERQTYGSKGKNPGQTDGRCSTRTGRSK